MGVRGATFLLTAAVIATAAYIHLSLKGLNKPFGDNSDLDEFEPAIPFAAVPAVSGVDVHAVPAFVSLADLVSEYNPSGPPFWITATNADEDRFNHEINNGKN